MVSCAGRALGLYSVSGKHVRLVATRSTRQQYRGLVRASDALVAAASPETRSVDLLDLGGRVLRSIMPVDFVRGNGLVTALDIFVVVLTGETAILTGSVIDPDIFFNRRDIYIKRLGDCARFFFFF